MRRSCAGVLLAAIASLLWLRPAEASRGYQLRPLVRSGDPTPAGTPLGSEFWGVGAVGIDASRRILLTDGRIVDFDLGPETRIWRYDPGSEALTLLAWAPQPLTATQTLKILQPIGVASDGTAYMAWTIEDIESGYDTRVVRTTATGIEVVVQSGDAIDTGTLDSLEMYAPYALDGNGGLAFIANVRIVNESTQSVLATSPSGVRTIAKLGDPAPGSGGRVFGRVPRGESEPVRGCRLRRSGEHRVGGGCSARPDRFVPVPRRCRHHEDRAGWEAEPLGGLYGEFDGTAIHLNAQRDILFADGGTGVPYRWRESEAAVHPFFAPEDPVSFDAPCQFPQTWNEAYVTGLNDADDVVANIDSTSGRGLIVEREIAPGHRVLQGVASICEVGFQTIWGGSVNAQGDIAFATDDHGTSTLYLAQRDDAALACLDGLDDDGDGLSDFRTTRAARASSTHPSAATAMTASTTTAMDLSTTATTPAVETAANGRARIPPATTAWTMTPTDSWTWPTPSALSPPHGGRTRPRPRAPAAASASSWSRCWRRSTPSGRGAPRVAGRTGSHG